MSKHPLIVAALAVCTALAPASWAADATAIRQMIETAETLRQEAAGLEFEWRWTAKHIKDAQKALDENKLAEAEKLAKRAKREAELAIEQAKIAERVWQIAVPK